MPITQQQQQQQQKINNFRPTGTPMQNPTHYRQNPYKHLNYMPPIAQKNRHNPEHPTQLPQGQQFFNHAIKKHYDMAYRGEIQGENVMKMVKEREGDQGLEMSVLERQAQQRSYFRSLNSQDIEGAGTNTLISKAVKNKMKAQQQLQRRKQIQKQQQQQDRLQKYQQELQTKKYLQHYNSQLQSVRPHPSSQPSQPSQSPYQSSTSNPMANQYSNNAFNQPLKKFDIIDKINNQRNGNYDYDQIQKKKRQQELMRLAQQRKNYAIVDFSTIYGNGKSNDLNGYAEDSGSFKTNFHQLQLERRKQSQRQSNNQNPNNKNQQQQQNQYQNNSYPSSYPPEPKYPQKQKQPIQRQNSYQQRQYHNQYYNQNQNQPNRQAQPYYQNYQNADRYQPSQFPDRGRSVQAYRNSKPQDPTYHLIQKDQQRNYQNYPQPYPITHPHPSSNPSQSHPHPQPDIYDKLTNPSPISTVPQFKNRQQLRRHNPTYLSYGSPTSFAIASRNVVGL